MRISRKAPALTALCAAAIALTVTCTHAAAPEDTPAFTEAAAVAETRLADLNQAVPEAADPALGALLADYADLDQGTALADDGFGTPAAGDDALDDVRGGFEVGNGLVMSLGIERLVSINGNLVSSQSLHIADVGRLSQESARGVEALAGLRLVQNGPGNVFEPGNLADTFAGTVIQNTLNNQALKTETIINSSVNSAELMKNINFNTSVRDALSNSIGNK